MDSQNFVRCTSGFRQFQAFSESGFGVQMFHIMAIKKRAEANGAISLFSLEYKASSWVFIETLYSTEGNSITKEMTWV